MTKPLLHMLFVGTLGHELCAILKWACDAVTCQYAHMLVITVDLLG